MYNLDSEVVHLLHILEESIYMLIHTNVYKNPRVATKFFTVTLGVLHKQEWITTAYQC